MPQKLNENQQFSEASLIQTLFQWAKSAAIKVNRMAGAEFTATYNPANLADGAGVTTTVDAPGAQLGDYVQASFSQPLQAVQIFAWVSAVGTVSVRFQNESGGAVDLASGTIKVRVSPE
jgi:hypothetical protein